MCGNNEENDLATTEQYRKWMISSRKNKIWYDYIFNTANKIVNNEFKKLDIGTKEDLVSYTLERIFNEFYNHAEKYIQKFKIRSAQDLANAIVKKYPYKYTRSRVKTGFAKLKPTRDKIKEMEKKKIMDIEKKQNDKDDEKNNNTEKLFQFEEIDIEEIEETMSVWHDEDIEKLKYLLSKFEDANYIYCSELILKYFQWSIANDASDFDGKRQYYHEYKGPHQSIFERVNGESRGSVGKCMKQFRDFVINNLKIARI